MALCSAEISKGLAWKPYSSMKAEKGFLFLLFMGVCAWGVRLSGASEFKERKREQSAGGKGGPTVTEYSYTVSFAIAICAGVISRIDRVWANGAPLSLNAYAHRIHKGGPDQLPDMLIEAVEGFGKAPAYRGTAYLVFEDFPLDGFGQRLPQFSFEVTRHPVPVRPEGSLSQVIEAVNIIPATGEFVYATEPVSARFFPAIEQTQNAHNAGGGADFVRSLDQLEEDLPQTRAAALTVGWFGSDLRAGQCAIRPGVETRDRTTRPLSWKVGSVGRSDAHLISRDEDGNANYGGTPSDQSVIQGLRDMVSRGLSATLTPFLLMDIPPGNGLTDPHGSSEQPAFPWRGRIICSSDGGSSARQDVAAFLGSVHPTDFNAAGDVLNYTGPGGDWGYRRFILPQCLACKNCRRC